MKTRIKVKNGQYYPQVKLNWWSRWRTLRYWWGDHGPVYYKDGTFCCNMLRQSRVYADWMRGGWGQETRKKAEAVIKNLNIQGCLYNPKCASPYFKDNLVFDYSGDGLQQQVT